MQTTNAHSFTEHLSEFYHYLTGPGGVNAHSRTNYISWLKFLDEQGYALTELQTYDDIDDLLATDASRQQNRSIYTKPNDIVNFKSALRKYLKFRQSDFAHQQEDTILAEINKVQNDATLSATEREAIVKVRVGQGKFRDKLVDYWRGCSISTFSHFDLLIARISCRGEMLTTSNALTCSTVFCYCRITTNCSTKVIFRLMTTGELSIPDTLTIPTEDCSKWITPCI